VVVVTLKRPWISLRINQPLLSSGNVPSQIDY
jgi:hypothetical protein